jgi:hypothetical protein
MDCLALLEQAGREGAAMPQAAMHQAVASWLAKTSASQAGASRQAAEAGGQEGYRAGGRQVESTPAEAVTKRLDSSLGAGIWRRIRRRY